MLLIPIQAFRLALGFLTVLPLMWRGTIPERRWGHALAAFPLVGALLGGVTLGVRQGAWLLGLSPALAAALAVAASVLLTGGLHLDGLMDAADGLLGGNTPEQRLTIMHDERVGAFGALAGMVVLLLKFAALQSAAPWGIVLAATWSRTVMALSVVLAPSARPSGLGAWWKTHARPHHAWMAGGLAGALSLAAGWWGIATGLLAALFAWGMVRWMLRRVPGLTGDLYGALGELSETLMLLLWAS